MIGFRDSILKFINPFIYILLSFEPTDVEFFQVAKEKLKQNLRNSQKIPPYILAMKMGNQALISGLAPS